MTGDGDAVRTRSDVENDYHVDSRTRQGVEEVIIWDCNFELFYALTRSLSALAVSFVIPGHEKKCLVRLSGDRESE